MNDRAAELAAFYVETSLRMASLRRAIKRKWPDLTPDERQRAQQIVRELWLADRAFDVVPR